jgi:peptidoglycan/LPS O-acetylase OafA/YrhL
MTDTKRQNQYFYTLSGIRGIAALAVVTFHISPFMGTQSAPMAWSAVDLFFLLSGVVIETSYGRKLRSQMDSVTFLKARVLRLYPLYLFSTIVMIAAIIMAPVHGLFADDTTAQVIVPHLFQICALGIAGIPIWFSVVMYPLNQPAWSLFFEGIANYLYAATFRRLTTPALLGLISLGLAGIFTQMIHPYHGRMLDGISRVMFSFFMGVFLARARPHGIKTPLRTPTLLLFTAIALFLRTPTSASIVLWIALITLVFPALILAAMSVEPAGPWLPVCRILGQISYPIYVFHVPVSILIFDVLAPMAHLNMQDYTPWAGIGLLAALSGMSVAIDLYIDTPLRRVLYRALIPTHQGAQRITQTAPAPRWPWR